MSLSHREDRANGHDHNRRSSTEALIVEARAGSTVALGQLMEGCKKYLLLLAHRGLDPALRPKAGASDLVQETYYEAQRDFLQFRGVTEQEFFAWLTGVMNHRLANHVRHFATRKRDVGREVPPGATSKANLWEPADQDATPRHLAMARDEEDQLLAAVARLPDTLRRVLVLHTWERVTFVEIGKILNTTTDAARKQWGRAVRRLQQELVRYHDS